jgi:pimeloyl-ACP methyl ester carboxylesterase
MTGRFVQTNNIQLHYLDHAGSDPPLVLLPGLTSNAHSFDGLIQADLISACRVLALDLRGRGLSDKPETGYNMADHAADVIGLLDALGLEQIILGGHSFGGLLTFYMAAHSPERITKLVILDAAPAFHPNLRELLQPSLDRLGKIFPSWELYLQTMKQMPFWGGEWDAAIERYYEADVQINPDGTVQARSNPAAIAEAVDKSQSEPWEQYLAAIRQPALLLNAPGPVGPPGTPPILPAEQARAAARLLPHGRYVEIPGNHWTMLFGPNARHTVKAITHFMA